MPRYRKAISQDVAETVFYTELFNSLRPYTGRAIDDEMWVDAIDASHNFVIAFAKSNGYWFIPYAPLKIGNNLAMVLPDEPTMMMAKKQH